MVQHYFIGFKIPEKQATQLDEIRSTWNLQTTHKVIPHASDLHVTLLYLGPVEDKDMKTLTERLEKLQDDLPSLNLTITGFSSFGSPKNPRVVFASLEKEPKLKLLQKNVKTIAESIPFKLDKKPYVPHITLAKKWIGQKELNMHELKIEPLIVEIKQFSIFSIHPQKIPSYIAVKTIQLKDE